MSRKRSGLRRFLVLVGVLALVVLLLFALATPVLAATLRVNNGVACDDVTGNPYCTIQAAVNAANGGDVIHVYPGTYNESVNLSLMNPQGGLTLATVNATGVPTPGTVQVHWGGPDAEIRTETAFDGDVIIDGFVVYSDGSGIDVEVKGAGSANRNLVIRNVTANGTGNSGIEAEADGDVTITNCEANNNTKASGNGIVVKDTGGNVTILDCEASGNAGTGIWVSNVYGTVTIRNCTANGNGEEGIIVSPGFLGSEEVDLGSVTTPDQVIIDRCTANNNYLIGIRVEGAAGDVTITDSTTNFNGEDGMYVGGSPVDGGLGVVLPIDGGDVIIKNCTANGNNHGFYLWGISGSLSIQACIALGNYVGVDLGETSMAGGVLVNGNIICGNDCGVVIVEDSGIPNLMGNWWGCAEGPDDPGCDPICRLGIVGADFTPWISKISASATVDPATAGQPTVVSFQFSGNPSAVYLGQGPGDLRGPAPFTVSTDNGVVTSSGFIGDTEGRLTATLTPAHAGTATVWVDGPCGLDGSIVLGVVAAAEFVPEPGTVLLLGSGLMGLAGYAGLRRRKR